jgi:excinuclease ABC subunit A
VEQLLKYMTSCVSLRAADAYSYNTGEKMVSYSDEQIKSLIVDEDFTGKRITILAR